MRLVLRHAVEDDDAVVQVDVVAGHADETLDEEEVLGLALGVKLGLGDRLDENDDVAAARLAIVNQRHPLGGRSERDAVDNEVIADQERFLHRSGGDDEVLREKGEDEQAHHQHGTDAGHGFKRRLLHLGGSWFPGGFRRLLLCFRLFFAILSLCCGAASSSSRFTHESMHHVEDAPPARKSGELFREFPFVSESII